MKTVCFFALLLFSFIPILRANDDFFLLAQTGYTLIIENHRSLGQWEDDAFTLEGGIGYFLSDQVALTGTIAYSEYDFIGYEPQLSYFQLPESMSAKGYPTKILESLVSLRITSAGNYRHIHPFVMIGMGMSSRFIGEVKTAIFDPMIGETRTYNVPGTDTVSNIFFSSFAFGAEIHYYQKLAPYAAIQIPNQISSRMKVIIGVRY